MGYDWDNAGPVTAVPLLSISRKRPNTNYEKLFREAFPNADYREMDGVGHFLHLEKPDEFNAIVLEFVDRIPKADDTDEMNPNAERFMSRALELAAANASAGTEVRLGRLSFAMTKFLRRGSISSLQRMILLPMPKLSPSAGRARLSGSFS